MERDLSNNGSLEEEQPQASGDTGSGETTEPKLVLAVKDTITEPMETCNELNNKPKGDGDTFVSDVLNKLLHSLQTSETFEETAIKNVQNILQNIDSQNFVLGTSSYYDLGGIANHRYEDSAKINFDVKNDYETQNSDSSNKRQQTMDGGIDKDVKTQFVDEHFSSRNESKPDTPLDQQYPLEADDSMDEGLFKDNGSKCFFVEDQCSSSEDHFRAQSVDDQMVVDTESEVSYVESTLMVSRNKQLNLDSDSIPEEDAGDQASMKCFESGPIILFDLPPPNQNEELDQAAMPPPILVIPSVESIKAGQCKSKAERVEMVGLKHVASTLSCQCCYALPITSLTVHMCMKGHLVCGHCFGTGYRVCPACTKPLIARNACVERFLERLHQFSPDLFVTETIKMTHSHRPVECPHLRCQRIMASNTGLRNHYSFEHPSVQLYRLHYRDPPQEFTLPARCQGDNSTRAIALLEVAVGDVEDPGCDSVMCLIMTCSVMKHTMVAVWCAALYEGEPPLTYRLQANTSRGGELAMTADVVSLHSWQKVWQVLDRFPCLLLSVQDFNRQCAPTSSRQTPVSVSFKLTQ